MPSSDASIEIRSVLGDWDSSVAHQAANAPELEAIFTPVGHADAIDPDRSLVVGGRGVGKSFWSAVLTTREARERVAKEYPKLRLDKIKAILGFHEDTTVASGVAPSRRVLQQCLKERCDALSIWEAVLVAAVNEEYRIAKLPQKLIERVHWIERDPEQFEEFLQKADQIVGRKGERFLVVFDALDKLSTDWATIGALTQGVAQLALEMRGTRNIRVKIFMRRDQFNHKETMRFPDSSKLRTAHVQLEWTRAELYGLLFHTLLNNRASRRALIDLAPGLFTSKSRSLPHRLAVDEATQQRLFARIAGEFMGANHRRGRTYSWLYTHLADAYGQTSPRSFMIALKEAARHAQSSGSRIKYAIDHHGIREGVGRASRTRVDELQEDHPWVVDVLKALDGLTVPCEPTLFVKRWKERRTVEKIRRREATERPTTPLELELSSNQPEESLIDALQNLGVIEFRYGVNKLNVPDIFRVAAHLKRKGGVPPRQHT